MREVANGVHPASLFDYDYIIKNELVIQLELIEYSIYPKPTPKRKMASCQ